LDWDTGINLPVLFRGSWKLQPTVGISNATSGAFAIRNRSTNGSWVQQGKRFSFGATASPTLFAFFPGIGPLSRIRHSLSPVVTWSYEPAADIPEEYARAVVEPGQPVQLRSDASQRVNLSLSQTFEGKRRPPRGDTASVDQPKLRLLSISTSGVTYDFEQAKKPGRTGWATQTLTNSLLSDLLPGFNLSLTHDLWRGVVGVDTSDFDPFLQNVSASFAISGGFFRSIGSIFGLGGEQKDRVSGREEVPPSYVAESGRRVRPGSFFSTTQAPLQRGRAFSASFNYSLSRQRPNPAVPNPEDTQNLGFTTSFSPTPFWSLSWSSQFNITDSKFESQVVRLERDLHEWRAGFNFVRNPNGNFAFYFSIYLTDLPDLKFDYDQTTFEQ
jgi:LptD protein